MLLGLPAAASGPGKGAPQATAELALQRIEQLIGAAPCTGDKQCRVAPLGARSCGGPEGFRAWSVAHTREAELQKWLDAHAKRRLQWQQEQGVASTCELLSMPSAHCERRPPGTGRCVLAPAGAGLR